MKPFRNKKFALALLSLMLICSDITFMPVKADPETDPGTGEVTNPGDGETDPGTGEIDPGTGETDPGTGETNPGTGETDPGTGETDPGTGEEEEEEEYIPSTINTLSSLSVKGFELSPAFNAYTQEYNLTIDAGNKSIEISAGKSDSLSRLSGTGSFDVSWEVGSYDFNIVCTSESGSSRTYTIHLEVSSDPYIFAPLSGENLGFVVKGLDNLTNIPEGFEKSVGSYGGKEVTVFENDSFPFDLVYLQKENKKQDWYCYQDGLVTGAFRKLVINKTVYYYAGVKDNDKKQEGYTYKEVTLTGEQLDGWKVKNDSSKIMVYLYDALGSSDYYIYDTDDGTMQRRREYEVTETKENRSFLKSPVTITAIIVVIIAIVFTITFLKEGKKNSKKKDKLLKDKPIDDGQFDHTVELVKTSKIKIYANPIDPSDIVDLEIEKTKEFKAEDFQEDVTSLIEKTLNSQTEETEQIEENTQTDQPQQVEENIKTEEVKPETKKKTFFFKKKKNKKEEKIEETVEKEEIVVKQEVVTEEIEEDHSDEDIKEYIDHLFYSDQES